MGTTRGSQMSFDQLKKIYAAIPTFDCIPGCTDCCGPVPFSPSEWDRVDHKRQATSLKCPYTNGGCDIYQFRPLICRLFGAVDSSLLACPHGCAPVFLLPEDTAREFLRIYHLMMLAELNNDTE